MSKIIDYEQDKISKLRSARYSSSRRITKTACRGVLTDIYAEMVSYRLVGIEREKFIALASEKIVKDWTNRSLIKLSL